MPAPCKCRSVVKFSHSGRAGNARFLSKAAAAPAAQLTARGQHFKKQTRVVVDRNDVYDLKHYLEASNSVFECASGPSKLQLSFAELSVLFKPQPTAETQIAAFWASMSSVDRKDAAYGAILGAFVGDAAGGVLEFMDAVDAVHVDAALTMPGGGCWELGPGQITDDSEMAMCLLHGLKEAAASGPLPLDAIAHMFIKCRWTALPLT